MGDGGRSFRVPRRAAIGPGSGAGMLYACAAKVERRRLMESDDALDHKATANAVPSELAAICNH